MKLCFVFGTRPEAIKLAPLIQEVQKDTDWSALVCVTAQHRLLLDQMLELFDIRPDLDLNLMMPDQNLLNFSAKALIELNQVFDRDPPSLVVVQGDTTTALMAALAASYKKIPVAHIEAGLRSGDRGHPFPEEINRTLISQIAEWHFAPTEGARAHLLREGISDEKIFVTGNTVVDALDQISRKIGTPQKKEYWNRFFREKVGLAINGKRLMMVTTHRRESFGQDMESICQAIGKVLESHRDLECLLPVHPNPNVKNPVEKILGQKERVHLIDPLDYEPFLFLLMNSSLVLTDSGGVQEEAPSFGVPVVVMRKATERPELIEHGFGELAGTETSAIVSAATRWLAKGKRLGKNPFGDGQASQRILQNLKRVLANSSNDQ